ncbi:MAG: TonB-dependent receptor [Rhodocyclaceae bacterium]|nr:TonB-dependent receptor [Rhodocyclaceae bacterium]MDP3032199.1 TonB-dependent receptor [Rhodocyclaceae bacterium]
MKRLSPRLTLISLLLATAGAPAAWAKTDLTALSLEQLLEVTIVGASKYAQKQDEVAAAAVVITRNEIKAFGWRTLDEALASLPGIHTSYDRQYSYIGTRGFGLPGDFNTRILLTINGNRVNDVVYDGAASGRDFPLDMDLIERIEYIPGPGGAVYGQNALFGVVNVVTRKGAGVNGTELGLAYQDLNSVRDGRFTWGKKLDNGLDVLVSTSGHRSRGEDHFYEFPGASDVDPLWRDSGVASGMNGTKGQQLFASFARGPWFFDFAYGDNRKDDPTAQYFSKPLEPGQYQRDKTLQTQLQYQDSFAGDTLQLTGRLFLGRQRYTGLFYYADSPYLATGSSDWQGAELRLLSTRWAGHKLMLGLELQENTRRDQTNLSLVDSANNLVIPGTGWRAGMFVQDEWALNNSLSATLGLRFDRNSVTGNTLSPRAALIWLAAPSTTMKALYGRSHRAPNAYERDYADVGTSDTQVANPGLGNETIDTLELVLDQRLGKDLGLRGSLYRWNMRDLVVLGVDPGSGLSQYQNGGDVEATGIELSANKTWDWGGRLRGSLSHQDVAYKGGSRLDNSPQLLGKLNFSGPLAGTGLRFGAELQYTSKRQTIDGTDLDAYWLANLHLSTDKWARGLEVSLGLYNLFNQRYAHPGSDINWQNSILQDGRSARLKAIYHF